MLVPLLDLANHDPSTKNNWEVKKEAVSFICPKGAEPGEEIFYSYGPKGNIERKSYSHQIQHRSYSHSGSKSYIITASHFPTTHQRCTFFSSPRQTNIKHSTNLKSTHSFSQPQTNHHRWYLYPRISSQPYPNIWQTTGRFH